MEQTKAEIDDLRREMRELKKEGKKTLSAALDEAAGLRRTTQKLERDLQLKKEHIKQKQEEIKEAEKRIRSRRSKIRKDQAKLSSRERELGSEIEQEAKNLLLLQQLEESSGSFEPDSSADSESETNKPCPGVQI